MVFQWLAKPSPCKKRLVGSSPTSSAKNFRLAQILSN